LSGNHKEAIAVLERVLTEDPVNVTALEEVADNELSLEHYDRAAAAAMQAVHLDARSYTGHYILGFLHSIASRWSDAVEELRVANKCKPNNAEILRCLGWALFNAGQRPQGVVTLERSLNLEQDNTLTLCDLGIAYLELQNLPKAKALFLRALDLDPENARARECVATLARLEQSRRATPAPRL
jgi:tetratricopeptide (TPR) repeat protein